MKTTKQLKQARAEAGRLDGMLEKVADFYDLQLSFALKQRTTLLEPALLLPMFDRVKVLQGGGIR